jgi:hypothetical protein
MIGALLKIIVEFDDRLKERRRVRSFMANFRARTTLRKLLRNLNVVK